MKIHGTAKGGALSTKDFGVAFGGGAGVPTEFCQDTGSTQMAFANDYIFANIIGSPNTVIGKSCTALKYYLKKNGSATGTVYAEVYNSSGVLQHEWATKDVSTIAGSPTAYTFTGDPYTIQTDDKVGVRADISGGTIEATRLNVYSGTEWQLTSNYGDLNDWEDSPTQSIRMCLTGS